MSKLIIVLSLFLWVFPSRAQDMTAPSNIQDMDGKATHVIKIPLYISTLGTKNTSAEMGLAIKITDLKNADKEVSKMLIDSLQQLDLIIEEPKLDLDSNFLRPKTDWKTTQSQLNNTLVNEYNKRYPDQPMQSGYIYAIQYAGRYYYKDSELLIALTPYLYQRSKLGAYQEVSASYRINFFGTLLENNIKSKVSNK